VERDADDQRHQPVPGTVQLMTETPIEMPLSAAAGQSTFAEQIEQRPWLLAVGALGLLSFFLVLRRRNQG
jgi:LPXTG-motif cell wall-anchored protein